MRQQIARLNNVFYLSLSINVLTIIFEIKKKENAAVLTLLTDANLKILLYWWSHCIKWFRISKKKTVLLLTKDFFSSFHSCKFFHELCKKWNLKGNSIEPSKFFKYGLAEVKNAPLWMFDLVLNMPLCK